MKLTLFALTALALAFGPFPVAPVSHPSGDVHFSAVLDLKQKPEAGTPQLRGGQVADSKDWPASLYATFTVPGGTAACTAALIGPNAMLTAAHCVPDAGTVNFRYAGQSYATTCTRHPDYLAAPQDASADFALCTIAPAFAGPTGFVFEGVDTSGMAALLNKGIILTGYGCVSDVVANQQIDGQYRFGFNAVEDTSASSVHAKGADLYDPIEKNNLFTRDAAGVANLCPGDSGGPTFMRAPGGGDVTKRIIIGVNSRVFFRDTSRTSYGGSLISATGGPAFRGWAEQWAAHNHAQACGIAGQLPNCRS